jgi:prepilin-type N-terminal cleavage/methylation domain-containing protein
MRRADKKRGFTLIETMVAMAILMIGAVGVTKLFNVSYEMNGQARRATRAMAIAQDLLENISLWPYQDNVSGSPLANVSTTNDADIGDTQFQFQTDANPLGDGLADHGEADITALGVAWTGIPTASLGPYQRFWNVVYLDTNGNGVNDLVQVAVIVRWAEGTGWRRVVLLSAKLNPAGT